MPKRLKSSKKKGPGKRKEGKKEVGRKKAKTKLQTAIENYKSEPCKYRDLLRSADAWFARNGEKLIGLLKLHASYSHEHVTYDDFKAALVTMNIPMNKLETHMLTLLFDFDQDGFIQLDDLNMSLTQLSLKEAAELNAAALKILTPSPGWILGQFFCLSFLDLEKYPFRFNHMFRTTTSTERVVTVIKMQTGICSPEVTVYLKQEPDMEDQLRPGLTLLDQGFRGGDEWSPQLVKLFYCTSDYRPENWSVTEALKLLSPAHDPVLWSDVKRELEEHEKRLK